MNSARSTRSARGLAAVIMLVTATLAGITSGISPARAAVPAGNESVQVGTDAAGQTDAGTPLGVLTGITQISAGDSHSLALRSDGTVWAWGYNGFGQLGNNTNAASSTPVQVQGPGGVGFLTGITQISASDGHSLARRKDGTVWAWGNNGTGQLGNNTFTHSSTPVQVVGVGGVGFLTGITQISGGEYHVLARRKDGTVWAWGYNFYGRLGNNTVTTASSTPVQVQGPGGVGFLTGITQISAGGTHSLARRKDGTVWAWGNNGFGQLGNNTVTTSSGTPVQVLGVGGVGFLTGITQISADPFHSLARRKDGTVWAWGNNGSGQLGDNTFTTSSTPVQAKGPGGVGFLTGITQISAGPFHSLARRKDGTVWAWGWNGYGRLGNTTVNTSGSPVQVQGPGGSGFLTGITQISAGEEHSLARRKDGTVWAWGNNSSGELGNNTTTNSGTPVQVASA